MQSHVVSKAAKRIFFSPFSAEGELAFVLDLESHIKPSPTSVSDSVFLLGIYGIVESSIRG